MMRPRPFLQYLDDGGAWGKDAACAALLVCQPRRDTEWPTTSDPPWSTEIQDVGRAATSLVRFHPLLSTLTWRFLVGYRPSPDLDRWNRLDRLTNETLALEQRMQLLGIPDVPESFRAVRRVGYSLELDIEIDQLALLLSRERGWLHEGLCWGAEQPIKLPEQPRTAWDIKSRDRWVLAARSRIYGDGVCVHYSGSFDDRDACFAFTFATNHPLLSEASFRDIEPSWLASLA